MSQPTAPLAGGILAKEALFRVVYYEGDVSPHEPVSGEAVLTHTALSLVGDCGTRNLSSPELPQASPRFANLRDWNSETRDPPWGNVHGLIREPQRPGTRFRETSGKADTLPCGG